MTPTTTTTATVTTMTTETSTIVPPSPSHSKPIDANDNNNNNTGKSDGDGCVDYYYTWDQVSHSSHRWIVIENQVYDVSSFMAHHPGGSQVMEPYLGTDATRVFKGLLDDDIGDGDGDDDMVDPDVNSKITTESDKSLIIIRSEKSTRGRRSDGGHVHSKVAYKMLQDYHIGSILPSNTTTTTITSEASSGAEAPSSSSPVLDKKMKGSSQMMEQEARSRVAKRHLSKYGVDINKPLAIQVWNLPTETYLKWINDALPGTARLFASDWLEATTRTKWQQIPLFWVPVIISLIYLAVTLSWHPRYGSLSLISFVTLFMMGEMFWTWFEYCLHRFVFHWKPRKLYIAGIRLPVPMRVQQLMHFLLHGIHHILPMDGDRLVAPPALSISVFVLFLLLPVILPVFTVLYSMDPSLLFTILPACMVWAAGMGTGYLSYDLIHYYLHHGKPSWSYFKYLKSAHMAHHYDEHERYFGVSNPMFDIVMGTG